ncbi:protein KTI12, partial [Tremellales sp. Uapishka_1]
MALVTVSGFPCSGKSHRSSQLAKYFESRLSDPAYAGPKLSVVVVDDESNHVPRSVYDDSISEKSGRANIFAAVTRNLGPDKIVICDSPNYIKGFRYQMYCAAREAHARICTIHVATSPEQCREWHEKRGECSYKPATFDNLIMRYEEPSSMVRWDSPLFTIAHTEEPPFEAIWDSITKGTKAPPTASVVAPPKPPPNTLQIITATTSLITTSLLSHLASFPDSPTFTIPSPPAPAQGALILHLPTRKVNLSEMQRLKRQYDNLQTQARKNGGIASGGWTEGEIAKGFQGFLEATWGTTD